MSPIRFFVPGKPQPAGSKRAFLNKATGRMIVCDTNEKARPWKDSVIAAARDAYKGPLLRGPLRVTFDFLVQRPKGHFGTGKNEGKLRDSAPAYPVVRPDVLKLARGTEDALTGVIWADDAQTVRLIARKWYGDEQGVRVDIREVMP